MSSMRYEFIMSQIKHIRDIKENEKTKISLVFYEGCQGPCVFKICKDRDLSEVYQALMEVRHPNLTIVYDCIYENGNTYVLEEYIPGKTLAEHLKDKGTFTEEETSKVMMELCGGLEVLHRHEPPIIHNDIKASNIMIREDGIVKLFDFDISRTYKEGSYKNTKLMGTHEYAAPEHYGFGQSEPCTDIYSLGVTMHEMLTGVGLDHEHSVTYQGGMAKIVKKCVEIDRKKRYASAALLKADLEKYQKPSGIVGILVACACAFLLLTVGAIFLSDYFTNGKTPQNPTEDIHSEEKFETSGDAATEGAIGTEGIENTENDDIPEGVIGEVENSGTVGNTQGSVEGDISNSDAENNVGMNNDVVSSESENEEISIPKKTMKIIYNIQDRFLAMNAWSDGAFVLMEEIAGNYYLKSSDGKEKQLEGVSVGYRAQLEINPYMDQMYLFINDYNENYIYSVTKDLEIELIRKEESMGQDTRFLGFFSDGTLIYQWDHLNGNDWSLIEAWDWCDNPYIIHDKLYSLTYIHSDGEALYRFLEMNKSGKVVKEFPFEDEGIKNAFRSCEMYNNSKEVYFMATKDGKKYVYCFDGENYKAIVCLNDYGGYYPSVFEELCVTDTAIRYYSSHHNAIVEFTFE